MNLFSQAETERFVNSFMMAGNGCWEWTKGLAGNGYGYFNMTRNNRKTFHAHRVAWSLHHNREIPKGKLICHHCDNRKCVNPKHLYLGTSSSNNTDTIDRSRGNRKIGDGCSWSKISEEEVIEILQSNEKQYVLAERYNIDQSTVSNIKTGKRRFHVTGL